MLDEVVYGGAELAHGGGAALESLAGCANLLGGALACLRGSGDGLQLIGFLRQGLGDDVGEGGHSGAPVSCLRG